MTATRTDAVGAATVAAVVAFLGVLARYLGRPGYGHGRLVLFGALGAFAVLGAVGVVSRRGSLTAVGACGLVALGSWQAVLWLYVLPVAGLLALAGLSGSGNSAVA